MKSIFLVDVEDWFHILDVKAAPTISEWDELPSRVEKNFMQLLDMFSEKQLSVTCFAGVFFWRWLPTLVPVYVNQANGRKSPERGTTDHLLYPSARNRSASSSNTDEREESKWTS